jgi:hypothetical protein
MGNQIVGVRYIGKKDRQEDTVCKTGAVWQPGKVHNFGGDLAKALLVHTDSFEAAPIDVDGGTYLSRGKQNQARETAAFVNLSAMSTEQMVLMARIEFNRVVNVDGKDEAQVRREVHAMMANHNLDLDADIRKAMQSDGRIQVPYMATAEEHAALMAGTVVLAIVPSEIANIYPPQDVAINGGTDLTTGEPVDQDTVAKPLTELLASLEKPDLLQFAKQEGVSISNTMTAEKLREKISNTLTERTA